MNNFTLESKTEFYIWESYEWRLPFLLPIHNIARILLNPDTQAQIYTESLVISKVTTNIEITKKALEVFRAKLITQIYT